MFRSGRKVTGVACMLFVASLVASWSVPAAVAQTARPNIVLVMADDLGYETLGAYGSASYRTPELDRLAEGGMRFTHTYSQPLCTPSRVQIMTGRYNHRNYTNFGVLPRGEITFAHVLQAAGYATAISGKWQLRGHDTQWAQVEGQGQLPDEAGFDEYLLWQVHAERRDGERYAEPLVERNGSEPFVVEGGYGPDVFTDFLLDFIERQVTGRPGQPFFAYYPMALPHDPFVPTPDSAGWDGDRYASDPAYFADMVSYMDKVVGRIVRRLDELGVRDETLVLFTGDNGTSRRITSRMADGTTVAGDKGRPTDGGTRVPFIASWPGAIPGGRVSDALVDFTDFLPTLADAAGAELPADRKLDGHSLMPLLRGEVDEVRDWIFCDYTPRWANLVDARFARDRRYKLYADGRFYDVSADVLEERPLPDSGLSTPAATAQRRLQTVLIEMAGGALANGRRPAGDGR